LKQLKAQRSKVARIKPCNMKEFELIARGRRLASSKCKLAPREEIWIPRQSEFVV
jgi:hypothetical protein